MDLSLFDIVMGNVTNYDGDSKLAFTPDSVATDMIELLPDTVWTPDAKFLDINCKTGVFLIKIYNKLDEALSKLPDFADKVKRRDHILNNQLYGLAADDMKSLFMSRRNVFGDALAPHIEYIRTSTSNYESLIKQGRTDIIKSQIYKMLFGSKDKLTEEDLKKVKFDVVVGNPPYNNDIYLDFVTFGHRLSTQYTLMITPAKWQAKTDGKPAGSKSPDKNVEFRKNIVPFMSKIVYYRDTHDIFDIAEPAGISYFLMSKTINPYKMIACHCNKNKNFESDWEIHDEKEVVLLPRKILQVIGKMGQLGEDSFKQSKYVKNTDTGETGIMGQLGFKRFTYTSEQDRGEKLKQAGYVEIVQGDKVCGYRSIKDLFTTDKIEYYKCIELCMYVSGSSSPFDKATGMALGSNLIRILTPYQVPKGSFQILKYFLSYEEANSFASYINSKTMSLSQLCGVCGSTMTKEFFRFVPNPNNWTVTYVDEPHQGAHPDDKGYYEYNGVKYCSLYARYKLSRYDISIIESIIKKRS